MIALVSIVIGKPVCEWFLRQYNAALNVRYLSVLQMESRITWSAAATGALVGTWSHIVLDSIMHSDVTPFAPFSDVNVLYHFFPTGFLYMLCVILGVAGLAVILLVGAWRRWSVEVD